MKLVSVLLLFGSLALAQVSAAGHVTVDRQFRALLTWSASSSPGVTYHIYRNGSLIGTTSLLIWTDANTVHGQTYTYGIRAYDPMTGRESNPLTAVATIP